MPAECQRDPNWAHHIVADLTDIESLEAFLSEANALLGEGALGALVNNAAVSPKTPFKERLGVLNGDLDGWRQVFELNLFAPLALARGFGVEAHRVSEPDEITEHVRDSFGRQTPLLLDVPIER